VQVGAWQEPPEQTPLVQSAEVLQPWLDAQRLLHVPPQSTSVSAPFFTWSPQIGLWHTFGEQTPLTQSTGAPHDWPGWHPLQPPPPQSTAFSLPFFTPSLHEGGRQRLVVPLQTPLAQSVPALQVWSVAQREHEKGPPQSTSVSWPFLTRSLQLGARQRLPMHDELSQSVLPPHRLPAAHGGQTPPPQSASDSPPLRSPSLHVGAAQTLLGAGAQ
jgi:hypothetical protein